MNPQMEQQSFSLRGRVFLRWTHWFLFIAGAVTLAWVALSLFQARLYQQSAGSALDAQVRAAQIQSAQIQPAQIQAASQLPANLPRAIVKEGEVLGRMEISRLGMSIVILEGTSSRTLRLGVGHIAGTAFPGEPGNIGIAGHRDSYFRALKDIRSGDEIGIQTATGLSRYQVDRVQMLEPSNIAVLAPTAIPGITLVTCYPFYFVGPAPRRFVVHAHHV
jgi:LPXTG-site transpeptidase (sortase) family protein